MKTWQLGIIGHPLGHTYSPQMHEWAIRHYKWKGSYATKAIAPENFDKEIKMMKEKGTWHGFNVTIPYKERIIPYLDAIDDAAARIGAVNTVLRLADGGWKGFNTDAEGFVAPIHERLKGMHNALMVGAGGAARAVLAGLARHAPHIRLYIKNRTKERAKKLTITMAVAGLPIQTALLDDSPISRFDLIINTTQVGMGAYKDQTPLPRLADLVHANSFVYDLIYNPEETLLLQQARQLGCPFSNGLPMLVEQGSQAFNIWTGRPFPPEIIPDLFEKRTGENS
ncbi:MAG: shikimate dehydrogenase [Calditrichaeota bacterium]|nr:MAG: shikimate dehydrogenase [Calditrichota bacterium]